MNTSQIEYFISVYENRSFTQASEACFISQPSLWASIKRLESLYGAPLFISKKKKVYPTPMAHHLYPKLKEMLNLQQTIHNDIKIFKRKKSTPLNIGIQHSIGPKQITQYIFNIQQQHPNLELSCHFYSKEDLLLKIKQSKLDIYITSGELLTLPDITSVLLYSEPYVVIMHPSHHLKDNSSIQLEDLTNTPYIDRLFCETRDALISETTIKKINLFAQYRSQRDDFIQEWVASGLGIAIMPKYSVTHQGLLSIPYNQPSPKRDIIMSFSEKDLNKEHLHTIHAFKKHEPSTITFKPPGTTDI